MATALTLSLSSLGLLVLARWGCSLAADTAIFFRRSGVRRYLEAKPNASAGAKESWALITGSGAGLGRALAFELAGWGFNIVLHGSNAAKLEAVKEELQAAHPSRSVRTLVLDARIGALLNGADLEAKLNAAVKSLDDIHIRILVNNVGMPQARPEVRAPFDALDTFTYDELLINVAGNAVFPLLLTRALYPQLIRNQPALIINMGSLAAEGFPLFPSYGPAKAFLMASTAELRLENRIEGRDIEVLGIDVVGVTGTDTIKDKPNLMLPDAPTYAKSVVRIIGCGHVRVAPYLPHAIFLWVIRTFPLWLGDKVKANMLKGLRAEAAAKLQSANSSQ
ncbi:unnamed protein product [Clonostachys chloroleuca]|uniref:Uncharacterized protein n=1 Tax=Clonostachys chloroleuca TaxID=1926264 RepID=A0AA35M257_9HYPO|nr:unnamed protein product [Clonostachys chloroleuca]